MNEKQEKELVWLYTKEAWGVVSIADKIDATPKEVGDYIAKHSLEKPKDRNKPTHYKTLSLGLPKPTRSPEWFDKEMKGMTF